MPRCNRQVTHGSRVKLHYSFPAAQMLLLMLAALLCTGGTIKAQSRIFLSALDAGTGAPNTVSVETADFNNDGVPDLVTANYSLAFNGLSVILGKGDGTFQPARVYPTETSTFHVAVADFNRDGNPDLVATSTGFDPVRIVPGVISVLLGNGDGTFRSHIQYKFGQGAPTITAGDFNNDGNPDLATASSLFLGNGDGTLQPATNYGGGVSSSDADLTAADFNQDGRLDIVTTNYDSEARLYLGKGDGTFQSVTKFAAGAREISVSTGDLNADGKLDLAVVNAGDDNYYGGVSVLIGKGDGTFQSPVSYGFKISNYPSFTESIVISDLNGDGKLDLAILAYGVVRIMIGNGDGTFQSGRKTYITRGRSLTAADYNGDGKPDLVTAGLNSSDMDGLSVLLGNGNGTFQGADCYDAGGNSHSFATGDFNADGKLDLVTAHYGEGSIGVLLGVGDGSLQTPINYAAGPYPDLVMANDFNGDGRLDLAFITTSYGNSGSIVSIGVMLGNSNGTFQNAVTTPVDVKVLSIVAGDFNGDGKADLVAGDTASYRVVALIGKGDGTFSSAASFYSGRLRTITTGDFNGDGKLDLAGADIDDKFVSVLIGGGDGTFQSPDIYPIKAPASDIITEDFNRDGKLDLAFVNYLYANGVNNYYAGSLGLLFGKGDGTFESEVDFKIHNSDSFSSVVAADFNGDGKLDAAGIGSNIAVMPGNADGTFQNPLFYTAGYSKGAAGDFNGDGKPDLVTTSGDFVSMLLNIAPGVAPTQVDGKVLDSNGAPLGGVTVTLKSASRTQQAVTDATGHYAFTNLLIGDFYTLTSALDNRKFSPALHSFSFTANKTGVTFRAAPKVNPLDSADFFVRQQYLDFLGREPDQGGLDYWSTQLSACGSNQSCINNRRIDISAAFFIEQEFQQTGFLIIRIYRASLGRQPTFAEFKADRDKLAGQNDLEAKRRLFVEEFTRRAEFKALYPDSISNTDFVNKLFDTANLRPYVAERQARIVALNLRTETRAEVLRDVAEMAEFKAREYNPAFVLSEYFGYLGRDADEAGYQFWLNVLNNRQPNNYRGMVCAFITSAEYQQRFGSVITHSNAECGP